MTTENQSHTPTGFRFFKLNDRMLRLVRSSETDARLETHLCEIPTIYGDDAAFIVRACNSHAALTAERDACRQTMASLERGQDELVKQNAALVAALEKSSNTIRSLIHTLETIDSDERSRARDEGRRTVYIHTTEIKQAKEANEQARAALNAAKS